MGYTTDFSGSFTLNKPLDAETLTFLHKFNHTRRMKRNVKGYGIDGEFYVDGKGFAGQDKDDTIVNYNCPPSSQPGLWCQWRPNVTGTAIEWDGGEKFYCYVEWIQYLIDKVLSPKGYSLTGDVTWGGEDRADFGVISIVDNVVSVHRGALTAPKAKRAAKPKRDANAMVEVSGHTHDGKYYFEAKSVVEAIAQRFSIQELNMILAAIYKGEMYV